MLYGSDYETNMRIVAKHLTGARKGETDIFSNVPLTIGRLPASSLRLGINDTRASARHAEITLEKQEIVLRDVGSTNGTFVNGDWVLPGISVRLADGDIVRLAADVSAEVVLPRQQPDPASLTRPDQR